MCRNQQLQVCSSLVKKVGFYDQRATKLQHMQKIQKGNYDLSVLIKYKQCSLTRALKKKSHLHESKDQVQYEVANPVESQREAHGSCTRLLAKDFTHHNKWDRPCVNHKQAKTNYRNDQDGVFSLADYTNVQNYMYQIKSKRFLSSHKSMLVEKNVI